jgi:adenylate cyclase
MTTPFLIGDIARSQRHARQILALCDPTRTHPMVFGPDALAFAVMFEAHIQWLHGYPDRAMKRSRDAITRAEQIGHPQTLAVAYAYATLTCQFRRDRLASRTYATTTSELCARYSVIYYGEWGTIVQGWEESYEHADEAAAAIRRGLDNLNAMGALPRRPYYMYLLADVLKRSGRTNEARTVLDAALAVATGISDLWWSAELHRLMGELSCDKERWFGKALEIARSQGSRSLELRTATSLARYRAQQGAPESARALLAPVFAWFTEGLDTSDLVEARTLLDTL